ncbi:MAG: response regulator [Ktedonobacteraceae bacterium]
MQQYQGQEQEQAGTILIVEDDVNIGQFLIEVIQQETPYKFVLTADGLEALQIAEKIKPHLLILNYHLPHMNGIELYDRLHALKEFEDVPAIMVSAVLPEQEVKQRSIIGIKKPFDLDILLNTIEGLLA